MRYFLTLIVLVMAGQVCYGLDLKIPDFKPSILAALDDEEDEGEDLEETKKAPQNEDLEDDNLDETPKKGSDDLEEEVKVKPKDEFALEKRDKETYEYKEPEIAKMNKNSFLYTDSSVDSRKLFELYENDELALLDNDEASEWIRVEFLGKEGWVERSAVSFPKFDVYRLFADINAGASYSPEMTGKYQFLGTYNLMAFYGFHDMFAAGAEFKMFSINADTSYMGAGAGLRFYIPYLETKKSKTALTATIGYIHAQDRAGFKATDANSTLIDFNGVYVSVYADYIYRFFERFYFGAGVDMTYASLNGKTTENLTRSFFVAGAHIKVMFNIWK